MKEDESSDGRGNRYVVEDVEEMESSRGNMLKMVQNELRIHRIRDLSGGLFIHPENKCYKAWEHFILIMAIYSSFITPFEFGFFRGLPQELFILDNITQFVFFIDFILQFFVTYRDNRSYTMVYNHRKITLRYLKSYFVLDLLGFFPWDLIYKYFGDNEEVRYLLWLRLTRLRKVIEIFQKLEKDIRINYLFTRIVKLLVVELYCTHTAACIFYYLATTVPRDHEGYTWIGSLTLGDYSYSHFRDIDLWKRYITALYFTFVTMTTVGYGDIHAVNPREMAFVIIFVSFSMIVGAYLIGNITALIVKGSKTVKYRDRMTELTRYINRNRLGPRLRDQIKGHLRLEFESSYTDADLLREIPVSIRAEISQTLYKSYVENVVIFRGCNSEFINQIVALVHEEFFLPGEVIMEPGNVVNQLYIVCQGVLEEIGIGPEGPEETLSLLEANTTFGEISILCGIPQPYTIRVRELCRLLRIDKQSFSNILQIYFHDSQKVLTNLLEDKSNHRVKQLVSDIAFHIGRQEAELAIRVINTAYYGDIYKLKNLVRSGADPNRTDYDGRSPLHIAAARGYEDITLFLIEEGVNVNTEDNFGNTPLLEAIKNGHERVASILSKQGALFKIKNVGSYLCTLVSEGDSDLLRRLLSHGMDPNSTDYDHRTPLHVAVSQGLYLSAKLLVDAGANVFYKDRWGNTPLDEARNCGNKKILRLIEEANQSQSSKTSYADQDSSSPDQLEKCMISPFHPWSPEEADDIVPETIHEVYTDS